MNEKNDLQEVMDEFSTRFEWLKHHAGELAGVKLMNGRIVGTKYSGEYVSGILPSVEGYRFMIEMLDKLIDGWPIPLVDIDSYYAHGKRVPAGMCLCGGGLVDVWPEPRA